MTINHTISENVLTVIPEGRLDSSTGDEFGRFLDEHFTEDEKKLVIDLSEVDFVSSKGLRVLVAVYKNLNGRDMEIIGANTSVREILRISGLTKVFNVA